MEGTESFRSQVIQSHSEHLSYAAGVFELPLHPFWGSPVWVGEEAGCTWNVPKPIQGLSSCGARSRRVNFKGSSWLLHGENCAENHYQAG